LQKVGLFCSLPFMYFKNLKKCFVFSTFQT